MRKKILIVLSVLFLSATAFAGLHAYTHNLKMKHSMLDLLYWSEIESSYSGISLG